MYIFIFLVQLSLRDNPLVVRFVSDMTHNPPSLLELAARVIKTNDIRYDRESIPRNLVEYLNSGHRCVNSKCKGQRLDLYKIQSSISLTTSNIHFFFDSWSAALSRLHYCTLYTCTSPWNCFHISISWNKLKQCTIIIQKTLLKLQFSSFSLYF